MRWFNSPRGSFQLRMSTFGGKADIIQGKRTSENVRVLVPMQDARNLCSQRGRFQHVPDCAELITTKAGGWPELAGRIGAHR